MNYGNNTLATGLTEGDSGPVANPVVDCISSLYEMTWVPKEDDSESVANPVVDCISSLCMR